MNRLVILALLIVPVSTAQTLLIRGATVHTLAGDPVEGGDVLIQDGVIQGVGSRLRAPRGATVVDARGKHLYPGLFDAYTPLGLNEISAVGVTSDQVEKGDFNPHLKAAVAVNPDSEHIAVTRSNGVTHALTTMSGGVISGRASVIQLGGWTSEEMTIQPGGPLVLHWPRIRVRSDDKKRDTFAKAKKLYEQEVAEISNWLEAARHYALAEAKAAPGFRPDPKLSALAPAAAGEEPVLFVAARERAIRNAVAFAEQQGMQMILVGGAEAWKAREMLAEKKIPVILGPTQALPLDEDTPYDRIFTQPGELQAAGVQFAISSSAPSGARAGAPYPKSRSLPYEAAGAVPFGLDRDEALKAITVYPAQILGLGDKLGTIEEGKIANLMLTDGDPLEISTQVERLFIDGKEVSTDNKHQELYERYSQRP